MAGAAHDLSLGRLAVLFVVVVSGGDDDAADENPAAGGDPDDHADIGPTPFNCLFPPYAAVQARGGRNGGGPYRDFNRSRIVHVLSCDARAARLAEALWKAELIVIHPTVDGDERTVVPSRAEVPALLNRSCIRAVAVPHRCVRAACAPADVVVGAVIRPRVGRSWW